MQRIVQRRTLFKGLIDAVGSKSRLETMLLQACDGQSTGSGRVHAGVLRLFERPAVVTVVAGKTSTTMLAIGFLARRSECGAAILLGSCEEFDSDEPFCIRINFLSNFAMEATIPDSNRPFGVERSAPSCKLTIQSRARGSLLAEDRRSVLWVICRHTLTQLLPTIHLFPLIKTNLRFLFAPLRNCATIRRVAAI
jgi:hypothetical protein